jgi:hypothetical protein
MINLSNSLKGVNPYCKGTVQMVVLFEAQQKAEARSNNRVD